MIFKKCLSSHHSLFGGNIMIHYQLKSFNQLTTEQLWSIYQLRVAIFVVEQKCYYQEVDQDDKIAQHLLGYDDNRNLVSYARLIPENDQVRIGRIAVAKENRGHGSGRKLFSQALISVKSSFPQADQINIQAQAYLKDFYSSFGFQATSDVYLETGIPHLDMVKLTD